MTQEHKKTVSDWTVIILGSIGMALGLSGLLFPASQYEMLGLTSSKIGIVIPGLLGSAGLSATYMGIMYIFGTLKRWQNFKHYLIFARLLMAVGFGILMAVDRAPQTYVAAAIWEAAGALLILLALGWNNRKTNKVA